MTRRIGRSSIRLIPLACLVLAICALVRPAASDDLWVRIVEPHSGQFVIGEVEVVAEVVAVAKVSEVEFLVDGRVVGRVEAPPYRLWVDLGEGSAGHTFEVVARDELGAEANDRVQTEALPLGTEYSVGLQQLYVTAKSRLGNRILDLERDDFTVQDDGKRQEIVTFARGDIPFTAVLLIDSSASMQGVKLESAMAGAEAFVRGMQNLDQAKLLMFSHEVLTTTPFSSVHHVLSTSLSGAGARGGTALNDYLFSALTMLEMQQGRRVVVLLSDGIDSHSVLDMDDVYSAARSSRALIYWLRLPGTAGVASGNTGRRSMSSAWRNKDDYRKDFELLEKAVDESGGRIIEVTSISRVRREFVEILRELREQYVLAYYPTEDFNDGRWHKVDVKVKRSSTRTRCSEGYVDY